MCNGKRCVNAIDAATIRTNLFYGVVPVQRPFKFFDDLFRVSISPVNSFRNGR